MARAAVTKAPAAPYSLADIIDDDALWANIFHTAFLSVVPLHATLDGCAQTLKTHHVTANQVAATRDAPLSRTAAHDTDLATARQWLVTTLNEDLDHDQQQLMIVDFVIANGWQRHPARLSSLMLAVVETANAAASHT